MHSQFVQDAYLMLVFDIMEPEEFGELLAIATAPVNLDSPRDQARRASARGTIRSLPNGIKILAYEEAVRKG